MNMALTFGPNLIFQQPLISKFTLPLCNIKRPSFELRVWMEHESEADGGPANCFVYIPLLYGKTSSHDKMSE